MSDEASPEPKQPKRRGRPPKVAKRHDPDEAPVDGNRSLDKIRGKEAGYRYFLATDEDIGVIESRGGEVCTRDKDTARPFFDDRRNAGDGAIKVKNLTLMKVREEDQVRHESFGLAEAKRRRQAMKNSATNQIGGGQYATIANHEGGFTRQAI